MKPRLPLLRRILGVASRVAGDRRGGTAIEYGLIAGLIVIVMIVALINLAGTTTGMWNNVSAKVTAAR